MHYRREIDGLRALAVLPVMFFHAGLLSFSGGFVGVDVFFVISGYLITKIILPETEAGMFTLATFYERRARRILPALFVMMVGCLPFAWLWLPPTDMEAFSQSLVATSLFSSNILFWQQSGYFEPSAELKPLLHTWSLAVEEQYYVLFPLLLGLLLRLGKRWTIIALAGVALLSLAAAQWGSVVDPAATFYLLPTRAWELLIGVLIAFHASDDNGSSPNILLCEFSSVVGLSLLAVAVFGFDKVTPSPSVYTLVPTIGTALIIVFATPRTLVGRLLGHKLLVGVGLISYSAYLWHQPILAFARHRGLTEPGQLLLGALAMVAFVPAYLSWRFVETPFRKRGKFRRREVFVWGAAVSAAFVAFGIAGELTRGFEDRLGKDQREFLAYFENNLPDWNYYMKIRLPERYRNDCNFYDVANYRLGKQTQLPVETISASCFQKNPEARRFVFIWGDSHAQQLYYGLHHALPDDWQILQVATSGCVARLNAAPNKQNYCEYANWFAFAKIAEDKPDVVIVGQDAGHDAARMNEIARGLLAVGVKKIIFTGPNPHWTTDLPKIVAYRLWGNIPRRTVTGIDRRIMAIDGALKDGLQQSASVQLVSVIDYFCNGEGCLLYYGDDVREGITSWDYGHLTPVASDHFARDVLGNRVMEGLE
jgi:peptidoglycan/LPS O-acetylase OafA/YrhL